MGAHDAYGKQVLRAALGERYADWGDTVCVPYAPGRPGRIDGTVGSEIAIEVESRVFKQVRGAVLDLMCHPYPKKLLLLVPMYMSDAAVAAAQCCEILSRFVSVNDFRVIVLEVTGFAHALKRDAARVRAAIKELEASVTEVPPNKRMQLTRSAMAKDRRGPRS
jgi:hypothetical protein